MLLLGLTTLSLTQTNHYMKLTNSISKKNFYIAEALAEEADMKLEEYLKRSIYDSYERVLKYIGDNDYGDMDVKVINRIFKSIFRDKFKVCKAELEDINNYNLKVIEGYDILVEVILEEDIDKEVFNITIISTCDEKQNIERIIKKYQVKFPEYDDFDHNKNLIKEIRWVNDKW